jgi:hypothetical protein
MAERRSFPVASFLLAARKAMLPFNVVAGPARVVRATGEILGSESDSITLRRTQSNDEIVIASECPVAASDQYLVERRDDHRHVTVNPRTWHSAGGTAPVTVRFDRV